MSINELYLNAATAFNPPYSEIAALNAYNYMKTYSTEDPDIKALISTGNLLALIGQTNRNMKEINLAINAAIYAASHGSQSYAISIMSAVKVSRDCVKQKCSTAAISASIAAYYGSSDAGAYNTVQTAYKTSGVNSAFICAAGSIYMKIALLSQQKNLVNAAIPIPDKLQDFYMNSSKSFNAPYDEVAAIRAYNYIQTYDITDTSILSRIAAGNLLALMGQTNADAAELDKAIEKTVYYASYPSENDPGGKISAEYAAAAAAVKAEYLPTTWKLLNDIKHIPVVEMVVIREALKHSSDILKNIGSTREIVKYTKKNNIDTVFHVYAIATLKDGSLIRIGKEKNSEICIKRATSIPNLNINRMYKCNVPDKSISLTIMLIKARDILGDDAFFTYSALNYNCQHFIYNLLLTNDYETINDRIKEFIVQDFADITTNASPQMRRIVANAISTLDTRFQNIASQAALFAFYPGQTCSKEDTTYSVYTALNASLKSSYICAAGSIYLSVYAAINADCIKAAIPAEPVHPPQPNWGVKLNIMNNTRYIIDVVNNDSGKLGSVLPGSPFEWVTSDPNNTNALRFWKVPNVYYMQGGVNFGPTAGVFIDRGWMDSTADITLSGDVNGRGFTQSGPGDPGQQIFNSTEFTGGGTINMTFNESAAPPPFMVNLMIANNTKYMIDVMINTNIRQSLILPNTQFSWTTDLEKDARTLLFRDPVSPAIPYMQGSVSFGPDAGVYIDRGWMNSTADITLNGDVNGTTFVQSGANDPGTTVVPWSGFNSGGKINMTFAPS